MKKLEAPKTIQYSESTAQFDRNGGSNPWDNNANGLLMNSSATSFYSDKSATLDGEQREKIKKATRKPFEIGRKSTQNLQKAERNVAPT